MGFERAGFGYTDTGKPEVRGYGRRWFAWGLPGSDRELQIEKEYKCAPRSANGFKVLWITPAIHPPHSIRAKQ